MNILKNTKNADVVLSFPTNKKRTKFFDSNCLERFGISEKPVMGSDTDCFIDNQKLATIIKIIAFAKKKFDAVYHINCGGKNLKDCGNYEKKCGNLCGYCQYMELD